MVRDDEGGTRLLGMRIMSNFRLATGTRFNTPRTRPSEHVGEAALLVDDRGELLLRPTVLGRARLSTDGFVELAGAEVAGAGRAPRSGIARVAFRREPAHAQRDARCQQQGRGPPHHLNQGCGTATSLCARQRDHHVSARMHSI